MMNYTTALPDFIEMQRVSFCWFIAQGLNEELNTFSRIYDFSQNTEYVLFGQEYSLVKPIYNIVRAKKYTANYSTFSRRNTEYISADRGTTVPSRHKSTIYVSFLQMALGAMF